jgi:hypothetical protein
MSLFTPPYARPKTDDEAWAGREDRLDRWIDSGRDIEPDE